LIIARGGQPAGRPLFHHLMSYDRLRNRGTDMAARGWAMMVSAVLALTVLAACSNGPPSVGSTALVERATITDQVNSSGAVAASASENLDLPKVES